MTENRRRCSVPECGRPHNGRGYCTMHGRRVEKYGDPLAGAKRIVNQGNCTIEGCDRPSRNAAMCAMHYTRKLRHGDPLKEPEPIAPRMTAHGYVTLVEPGHPLAGSTGRVYVHRKVLFDALGADPRPCQWCGKELHWFPANGQHRLCVDHLDWDRSNNEIANLVPCCGPCNSSRVREVRRGEALHSATLTSEDVLEIRASGLSADELASIYSVHPQHIRRLRRGAQWKHLLSAG